MQQVTNNVYTETTFQGCNSSFIVTKGGAVVIDTPMVPTDAQEWKKKIEEYAPIKYAEAVTSEEPSLGQKTV